MYPRQININQFFKERLTVFPLFSLETATTMVREINQTHEFVVADAVKGKDIKQHFEQALVLPDTSPVTKVQIDHLHAMLWHYNLLPKPVSFNSFMAQRYIPPQRVGISMHCDGKRFDHVIAVLVLEGGGDLYTYTDRDGSNPYRVPANTGDCIVFDNTVLHSVVDVYAPRVTLTGRFDLAPHKGW
ncbi:MAG: hypothetical protein KBB91_02940 [Candidatus Pacebacteria bacterium]|jgi:hypothetical protein|nr:hypothetical protein [Candidatus Paceibacterota bacterium]MBP9701088.1 hypothetical protein [Candidatus Paceibacterota bacterium]